MLFKKRQPTEKDVWKSPCKGELPEHNKNICFVVFHPSGQHGKHIGIFTETDHDVFKFKCSLTGKSFYYYQVTKWAYAIDK